MKSNNKDYIRTSQQHPLQHYRLSRFYSKCVTFARRKLMYATNEIKHGKGHCFTHITYYACTNVGDTVLSDTVRKGFETYFPDSTWRLRDVSESVDEDTISRYRKTDAIIIGGGGLFLPDTNKNSVSGWQWPCPEDKLAKIDSPIILYSVGFNYFRGQRIDPLFVTSLNLIIRKSAFVGLRNHGSIREVNKLLEEKLHSKVVYQPCLTTMIRKFYKELPKKVVGKKVAINIAFDRMDQRLGSKKEQILNEIANAIKMIEEKGYEIYCIAHILDDAKFTKYLENKNVNFHTVIASAWSAKKLILFYNDMDVVLGMRGHAQMIPFGVNCHIITLGSHDKMRWFLEDINALDWYIELSTANEKLSEFIVQKFTRIHEEESARTTQRLLEEQDKLYEITMHNFATIDSAISK